MIADTFDIVITIVIVIAVLADIILRAACEDES